MINECEICHRSDRYCKECGTCGHCVEERLERLAAMNAAGMPEPLEGERGTTSAIIDRLNEAVECYGCSRKVFWLAPDGRCSMCTHMTPEEVAP